MKLTARHAFACSPEELWELFGGSDFDRRFEAVADIKQELLEERLDGDVLVRRIRCTPNRELPMVLRKTIGADRFIYEQNSRLDRSSGRQSWEVVPSVLANKVTARGITTVQATPDGCERVVDGDITVKVRFVGGQIEKLIVGNVGQSFAAAARLAEEMLRER